jgi:Undecaprenyl-phosphate glucose phosphotransferase
MVVKNIPIEEVGHKAASNCHFKEFGQSALSILQMTALQMTADAATLITFSYLSLKLVVFLRPGAAYFPSYLYVLLSAAASIVMIRGFARSGVYSVFDSTQGSAGVLRATCKRLVEVILVLTGCLFVLKVSNDFSRVWLITWSITSAIGLCTLRLIAMDGAQKLIQNGRLTKEIAIVGVSELGVKLAAQLAQEGCGTRLVGLFDQRRTRRIASLAEGTMVHDLSALDQLLRGGQVDEVVIAIPPDASNRILQLARRFHPSPVSLKVVAPRGYENFQVLDSSRYGEIAIFGVMSKPLDDVSLVFKWIEDKVIASFCLLLTLPVMLLIAGLIKLDSRGPVLFKQKRLGVNNVPFACLKFRTMYEDQTDPLADRQTTRKDARVTRVGRWLRRLSLDELPQLLNVLLGEMSLVGPRPHAPNTRAEGQLFADAVADYAIRHRVKPGITGWAQVNGWRGETTTLEQIEQRVQHDLYYIQNWSLWLDLRILALTPVRGLLSADAF